MKKSILLIAILIVSSFNINAQIGALKGIPMKGANLDKKNVTGIAIDYDKTAKLALRYTVSIGITATYTKKNGKEKTLKTVGFSEGALGWNNYKIDITGGTFEDGIISIPSDPRKLKDNQITLTASPKAHPGVTQTLTIKLNYAGEYNPQWNGEYGGTGRHGNNGSGGSSNSSSGGGNGGSAADGGNGGNASNGHDLEVYVKALKDEGLGVDLLHVLVKSVTSGKGYYYIVDPANGKITINANGGQGGQGGSGGNGGNGGSGYSGGSGGTGGDGGDGGNGGTGGSITVYMDPSAEKYEGSISFSNTGGDGGKYGYKGNGGLGGSHTGGGMGRAGSAGNAGTQSGYGGKGGPSVTVNKQMVEFDMGLLGD